MTTESAICVPDLSMIDMLRPNESTYIPAGHKHSLENANLLKKLSFPRLCLPVVVVANAALNFAIIFGLFTLFLLVSGNIPGLVFLAVVPLLASVSAFAIGLGMRLFRRHAGDMVDEL